MASQRRRNSSRFKLSPTLKPSISCSSVAIICSFSPRHFTRFLADGEIHYSQGLSSFLRASASLPNPIQLRLRSNNQAVAGQSRGGQGHLAEAVFAKQLELGSGLDDIGVAVFAQGENFVRRGPGRGSKASAGRPQPLAF